MLRVYSGERRPRPYSSVWFAGGVGTNRKDEARGLLAWHTGGENLSTAPQQARSGLYTVCCQIFEAVHKDNTSR